MGGHLVDHTSMAEHRLPKAGPCRSKPDPLQIFEAFRPERTAQTGPFVVGSRQKAETGHRKGTWPEVRCRTLPARKRSIRSGQSIGIQASIPGL